MRQEDESSEAETSWARSARTRAAVDKNPDGIPTVAVATGRRARPNVRGRVPASRRCALRTSERNP